MYNDYPTYQPCFDSPRGSQNVQNVQNNKNQWNNSASRVTSPINNINQTPHLPKPVKLPRDLSEELTQRFSMRQKALAECKKGPSIEIIKRKFEVDTPLTKIHSTSSVSLKKSNNVINNTLEESYWAQWKPNNSISSEIKDSFSKDRSQINRCNDSLTFCEGKKLLEEKSLKILRKPMEIESNSSEGDKIQGKLFLYNPCDNPNNNNIPEDNLNYQESYPTFTASMPNYHSIFYYGPSDYEYKERVKPCKRKESIRKCNNERSKSPPRNEGIIENKRPKSVDKKRDKITRRKKISKSNEDISDNYKNFDMDDCSKEIFECTKKFDCSKQSSDYSKKKFNSPKEIFNCPKEVFNCPKEVFNCSKEVFNCPKEVFNCPKEVFNRPNEIFNCPNEIYDCAKNPKSSDCPKEIFNCPKEVFNCPKEVFNCPKEVFNCPKEVFNCPKEIFNCPKISSNCSKKNFNCSKEIFNYPKESFNCPKESFNSPKESFNSPKEVYNCPNKILNCSKNKSDCPKRIFNSPKKSSNCSKKVFNSPKEIFNCTKKSSNCPKDTFNCPKKSSNCPKNSSICPKNSLICPKNSSIYPKNSSICPKNSSICPKNSSICPKNSSIYPKNSSICLKNSPICPKNSPNCLKNSPNCPKISSKCSKNKVRFYTKYQNETNEETETSIKDSTKSIDGYHGDIDTESQIGDLQKSYLDLSFDDVSYEEGQGDESDYCVHKRFQNYEEEETTQDTDDYCHCHCCNWNENWNGNNYSQSDNNSENSFIYSYHPGIYRYEEISNYHYQTDRRDKNNSNSSFYCNHKDSSYSSSSRSDRNKRCNCRKKEVTKEISCGTCTTPRMACACNTDQKVCVNKSSETQEKITKEKKTGDDSPTGLKVIKENPETLISSSSKSDDYQEICQCCSNPPCWKNTTSSTSNTKSSNTKSSSTKSSNSPSSKDTIAMAVDSSKDCLQDEGSFITDDLHLSNCKKEKCLIKRVKNGKIESSTSPTSMETSTIPADSLNSNIKCINSNKSGHEDDICQNKKDCKRKTSDEATIHKSITSQTEDKHQNHHDIDENSKIKKPESTQTKKLESIQLETKLENSKPINSILTNSNKISCLQTENQQSEDVKNGSGTTQTDSSSTKSNYMDSGKIGDIQTKDIPKKNASTEAINVEKHGIRRPSDYHSIGQHVKVKEPDIPKTERKLDRELAREASADHTLRHGRSYDGFHRYKSQENQLVFHVNTPNELPSSPKTSSDKNDVDPGIYSSDSKNLSNMTPKSLILQRTPRFIGLKGHTYTLKAPNSFAQTWKNSKRKR